MNLHIFHIKGFLAELFGLKGLAIPGPLSQHCGNPQLHREEAKLCRQLFYRPGVIPDGALVINVITNKHKMEPGRLILCPVSDQALWR